MQGTLKKWQKRKRGSTWIKHRSHPFPWKMRFSNKKQKIFITIDISCKGWSEK